MCQSTANIVFRLCSSCVRSKTTYSFSMSTAALTGSNPWVLKQHTTSLLLHAHGRVVKISLQKSCWACPQVQAELQEQQQAHEQVVGQSSTMLAQFNDLQARSVSCFYSLHCIIHTHKHISYHPSGMIMPCYMLPYWALEVFCNALHLVQLLCPCARQMLICLYTCRKPTWTQAVHDIGAEVKHRSSLGRT